MKITAVIIALNEEPFIRACIKAIYDFVHRIIIITNFDTDYWNRKLEPDGTVDAILSYPDAGRKIHLIVCRQIMDEVLQRNWAMHYDQGLHKMASLKFCPHAHTLSEIKANFAKTDYFWIIDADEIYDPATIPDMIGFVAHSNGRNVLVRGYNYFKKWNYRINDGNAQFWQLGFLKAGTRFYSRRTIYAPRVLGWLKYLNAYLSQFLREKWSALIKLPEETGCFYHGSYIGDDNRMIKKLSSTSHARDQAPYAQKWMENVWKRWHPDMKNFYFPSMSNAFESVDYIPTSNLPSSIRESNWPAGWLD